MDLPTEFFEKLDQVRQNFWLLNPHFTPSNLSEDDFFRGLLIIMTGRPAAHLVHLGLDLSNKFADAYIFALVSKDVKYLEALLELEAPFVEILDTFLFLNFFQFDCFPHIFFFEKQGLFFEDFADMEMLESQLGPQLDSYQVWKHIQLVGGRVPSAA